MARRWWREAVDLPAETSLQDGRGKCVEVVLVAEQEHRRDPLELRASAGGSGEQPARGELEPGGADRLALPLQRGPQDRLDPGSPERSSQVDHPWVSSHEQGAAPRRADDAETPGNGHGGEPVEADGGDDDEEGDREDLVGSADARGHQGGGERRRGGGGDDATRGHPRDEHALVASQVAPHGGG